jgi:deoxycytidine triphosphate deaminase
MTDVLNDTKINQLLMQGQLMKPGSWVRSSIRGAAYDLRIAEDYLVVPDDGHPNGRRYRRGERRVDPIILQPGDVSFLSSMERLCLPWDITAHIGIKFSYARRGLLVLTGLLVDPGYGLELRDGHWQPKEDERLHFLVANVGPNTVALIPGRDKLASIQFFGVDPPSHKKDVPSGRDMESEFFDPNETTRAGLYFFKDMAELRGRQEKLEDRLRTIEAGSSQIMFFGVYLLAASFAAVGVFGLLSLVASDKLADRAAVLMNVLPNSWPRALLIISGLLSLSWLLHVFLRTIGRVFSSSTVYERAATLRRGIRKH